MTRSALIDSVKALTSQLIVLHHLALYSPMADWLTEAWPRIQRRSSADSTRWSRQ